MPCFEQWASGLVWGIIVSFWFWFFVCDAPITLGEARAEKTHKLRQYSLSNSHKKCERCGKRFVWLMGKWCRAETPRATA